MDWSNETVLEFLECYENEPIIWNPSLPNHKNRNEVFDAWKRIEIKMGQKYTVTELKKKKDSLMASFRACFNKVKQSIRSGTEEIYKPNWFAYEQMARFLKDKDQTRETITLEAIVSQEGWESSELKEEDISDNTVESVERFMHSDMENDEVILPSCSETDFKTPLRKKKKVIDVSEMKKKMDNAYSILQYAVPKPTKEKHVCDIYGELVAARLKSMDERSREICMHQIDNILFEMKMNCINSED